MPSCFFVVARVWFVHFYPNLAANSSSAIQQTPPPQQQQPRRVLSNLANTSLNGEDACRVPNSTVNSLASTVGSATASIHNGSGAGPAVVPTTTTSTTNKNGLILGKLYSPTDNAATTNVSQQQQNEAHIQSKIQKIKEQVNNSVANSTDYARTEMEQVQRPLSVQSIQRQISGTQSSNNASAVLASHPKAEAALSGIVSRAKEGLQQQTTQQSQPKTNSSVAATKPDQNLGKGDSFDLNIDTALIASKILTRPLVIKDLDFTDLTQQDDVDVSVARAVAPPPPPPMMAMTLGQVGKAFLYLLRIFRVKL